VPVFVLYQTAFATPDGTLHFRPDFYERDAGIWRQLRKNPGPEDIPEPAPDAVREAPPALAAAARPSRGPRPTRRPAQRPSPRMVEPRRR
jgi:hypothetical protein